jgi:hypothetical protein
MVEPPTAIGSSLGKSIPTHISRLYEASISTDMPTRILICGALAEMGHASICFFAILTVMEMLMYPIWGLTDPEGNIVTGRDDIRELKLIEIEAPP